MDRLPEMDDELYKDMVRLVSMLVASADKIAAAIDRHTDSLRVDKPEE